MPTGNPPQAGRFRLPPRRQITSSIRVSYRNKPPSRVHLNPGCSGSRGLGPRSATNGRGVPPDPTCGDREDLIDPADRVSRFNNNPTVSNTAVVGVWKRRRVHCVGVCRLTRTRRCSQCRTETRLTPEAEAVTGHARLSDRRESAVNRQTVGIFSSSRAYRAMLSLTQRRCAALQPFTQTYGAVLRPAR
jgi:hypothetical protein